MELLVDLEFISGDRQTKETTGQDAKHIADLITKFDWFNFNGEYVNMRNVRSFRVVSKKEREEHEEQAARENAELLKNFKF